MWSWWRSNRHKRCITTSTGSTACPGGGDATCSPRRLPHAHSMWVLSVPHHEAGLGRCSGTFIQRGQCNAITPYNDLLHTASPRQLLAPLFPPQKHTVLLCVMLRRKHRGTRGTGAEAAGAHSSGAFCPPPHQRSHLNCSPQASTRTSPNKKAYFEKSWKPPTIS